jgi:hypothetical protein
VIKFSQRILNGIGPLALLLVFASGLRAYAENRNVLSIIEQIKPCYNGASVDEPITIEVLLLIQDGILLPESIELIGDHQLRREALDANFDAARRAITRCLGGNTDLPDGKFEIAFSPTVNATSPQTDLLGNGAQPPETASSSENARLTEMNIKLYKDINLGQAWADVLSDERYTDCSEQGLRMACDTRHSFLGTDGTLALVFEREQVIRAIYLSNDASLLQNALSFFRDQRFIVAMIETYDGTTDLVFTANQFGIDQAVATYTAAYQSGLTSGFLSLSFLDASQVNILNFTNFNNAMVAMPTGSRMVSIDIVEEFSGVNVGIYFDPAMVDYAYIQENNITNEDF